MNAYEIIEGLKDQICDLIIEREKDPLSGVKDLSKYKKEREQELVNTKRFLEAATSSKEILQEIHKKEIRDTNNNRDDNIKVFIEMRNDYADRIKVTGKLELQLEKLKKELSRSRNDVAKLREELGEIRGVSSIEKHGDNPWHLGVPYKTRDKTGAGDWRDSYRGGNRREDRGESNRFREERDRRNFGGERRKSKFW